MKIKDENIILKTDQKIIFDDNGSYKAIYHSNGKLIVEDIKLSLDEIDDGTNYVRSKNNFDDILLNKLTGVADGATVGATWGSDIINQPSNTHLFKNLINSETWVVNSTGSQLNFNENGTPE